jgi:hypothetical protein
VRKIHTWRPRRSRVGELVQWNASEHAWLEDRGPKLYLIGMIDDASSRVHARLVLHDSTEENMRLRWSYMERYGQPVSGCSLVRLLNDTRDPGRIDDAPRLGMDTSNCGPRPDRRRFCISGGTRLFVRAQFGLVEQTIVNHTSRSRTQLRASSPYSNSRAGRA